MGGKGGLDAACVDAMPEVGCVYLSFLGGGAPLHTTAIKGVTEVACNDLLAHYRLVRLAVEGLGPVTVGDRRAWQQRVRASCRTPAADAMPEILEQLAQDRAG